MHCCHQPHGCGCLPCGCLVALAGVAGVVALAIGAIFTLPVFFFW